MLVDSVRNMRVYALGVIDRRLVAYQSVRALLGLAITLLG